MTPDLGASRGRETGEGVGILHVGSASLEHSEPNATPTTSLTPSEGMSGGICFFPYPQS